MDFGDILDQWEAQQRRQAQKKPEQRPAGSGKKLNAPSLFPEDAGSAAKTGSRTGSCDGGGNAAKSAASNDEKKQPQVNPMDFWLRRYGVVDKDALQEEEDRREAMADFDSLRYMPAEAELDLHGLSRDEAWVQLDAFITECRRRKLRKVLLIHGKGNHNSGDTSPVLSAVVRNFIERDYRLGASGHPGRQEGGRGATWVIIREGKKGED